MVDKALFSSNREDWETPQDFFDRLDAEFHFTLDAAASPENAKCENYYTKEDDALTKNWEGVVWCNAPYGKRKPKVLYSFVKKGWEEAQNGNIVVMLVASRTDVKWWHDYAMGAKEIRFVKGRLKFVGGDSGAPFPSAIVVFTKGYHRPTVYSIPARVYE